MKYTVASFFGGVGGIDLGFEKSGRFESIFINEFDSNAQKTIASNFPNVKLDERDIHEVNKENQNDVPKTDVVMGGFPCQAFSIAGYRKGFEDERGDLFFELFRIINHTRPQAIFIENVKNLVTHDNGNTFKVIRETLTLNGYYIKWKVMNAKDYGNIPQNRERIYIVGFLNKTAFDAFEFPEKIKLKMSLKEVINFDEEVDETFQYKKGKQKFYDLLEQEMTDENSVYQWRRQYVRENKSGVVPTLTANMGTGGHNVPLIKGKYGIRKLTPRETFNVQGFPQDFKLPKISNGQLYKQAGNSVTVPVITRIAKQVAKALDSVSIDNNNEMKTNRLYVNLFDKMSGESYLLSDNDEKNNLPVLTDEEMMKVNKKGSSQAFISVEEI